MSARRSHPKESMKYFSATVSASGIVADKLLENPEFEVKAIRLYPGIGWGLTMEKYSVNGLADVGYSDGVVVLDLEREED